MRRLSGVLSLVLLVLVALPAAPTLAQSAAAPVARPAAARTAVLEVRVIGHSVQGRPIRAWHLGDPAAPVKAVFIASMHGDEAQPARILKNLRDGRAIKGADVWVVPSMNPDGVHRHRRQNAHGVDLNRNFPAKWVHTTGHYASGPRAASEPETRAMMRFLLTIHPDRMVSFHQPLHGVDYNDRRPAFSRSIARALRLPVSKVRCGGVCGGTMTQWFQAHLPGSAVTVEYGTEPSRATMTRQAPSALVRLFGGHR